MKIIFYYINILLIISTLMLGMMSCKTFDRSDSGVWQALTPSTLPKNMTEHELLFYKGLDAQLLTKYFDAQKMYIELVNKKPEPILLYKVYSNLILLNLSENKLVEAKQYLSQLPELEMKVLEDKHLHPKFFLYAFVLVREKQFLQAIYQLENLIEKKISLDLSYSLLASIYLDMGSIDLGKKVIKQGLDRNPNNQTLILLHVRRLIGESRLEDANQYIEERWSEMKQKDSRLLDTVGYIHAENNELSRSIDAYKSINRAYPVTLSARLNAAVVKLRENKATACEKMLLEIEQSTSQHEQKLLFYNLGLLYAFHLNNLPKSLVYFDRYVQLGGIKTNIPLDIKGVK